MTGDHDMLIVTEPANGVRLLAMNRPAARNALTIELIAAIARALDAAATDPTIHAVVLTGDDKAFSAGADIRQMGEMGWAAMEDRSRSEGWRTIETFPKPLLAAVRGYALGAGNELAMLADLVVAGEGALFGQPEALIGAFPGDGGSQRLPRLVGRQLALRMLLTGERIGGEQALAAGLACSVVADAEVVAEAVRLATLIGAASPAATIAIKRLVNASQALALDEGLRFERELLRDIFGSSDHVEGMRAFLERRAPRWSPLSPRS